MSQQLIARLESTLDEIRELRNRRIFENRTIRKLDSKLRVDFEYNSQGKQRVAAKCKKVIVDSDSIDSEKILPDVRNPLLQLAIGCCELLIQLGPLVKCAFGRGFGIPIGSIRRLQACLFESSRQIGARDH